MEQILRCPPKNLSLQKMRQVKIMKALCKGQTGARIAKREKVTAAGVSKIRKRAATMTVARFLDQLIQGGTKARQKPNGTRPSPGRPGYEHFDQWVKAFTVDDEAIFELATLILTPDAQIATIAVREGRLSDYQHAVGSKASAGETSRKYLEKTGKRILRRLRNEIRSAGRIPVFWTRLSMQDTLLEDAFHRLNERFGQFACQGQGRSRIPAARPLAERFGPRFCHLVLYGGSEELCKRDLDRLTKDLPDARVARISAGNGKDFLRQLEGVLHLRRLTKSCAGFLPTTHRLSGQIRAEVERKHAELSLWEVSEVEVLECVKVLSLIQDYFAVKGLLPGMNSYLWSKVCYQDSIPFRTLPLRARVIIDRVVTPGLFNVLIRPMPGLEYTIWVPWAGSRRDLAKLARKRLGETPESKRFIYAPRQPSRGGARASLLVSADFLSRKGSRQIGSGQGVVLLPRHFLTPEPEIPVEDFAALAKKTAVGASVSETRVQEDHPKMILLHVPYVLAKILQRVQVGFYWDQLAQLEEWQSSLAELGSAALGSISEDVSALVLKLRPRAVLEEDLWDKWMSTGSNARAAPTEEEIEAGIQRTQPALTHLGYQGQLKAFLLKLATKPSNYPTVLMEDCGTMPSDTEPQISLRLLAAFAVLLRREFGQEDGANLQPPLPGNPADFDPDIPGFLTRIQPFLVDERMMQRETGPTDAHRDFENILKEVDADYLIRNLNGTVRRKFEADAKEWAKKCQKLICDKYWPKGELFLDKVRFSVGSEYEDLFDQNKDDATSICNDLLIRFSFGCRFVMRRVVENMQRGVLRGLPPTPLAVESEKSILSRWRSLLGEKLRRALPELNAEKLRTIVTDDPENLASTKPEKRIMNRMGEARAHDSAESEEDLSNLAYGYVEAVPGEEPEMICKLLRSRDVASETGCRKIFEFSHTLRRAAWSAAMDELNDAQPGSQSTQRILQALKLCRDEKPDDGGPSKQLLKELQRIFSK